MELSTPRTRVLLVDDEKVIVETLALILNANGYETHMAFSGVQAIELASGFRPGVLITDVVMPGMTGIEAASRIQEMIPSCHVLLLSGHAAVVDLIQQTNIDSRCRSFEIHCKPIHPQVLLGRLGQIVSAKLRN